MKHMAPRTGCQQCGCDCYYCERFHNAGNQTCCFGHASYCSTRPQPPAFYEPKHMVKA